MFDEAQPVRRSLMQDPAFAQALQLCGQQPLHLPCGLMVLQRRIAGLRIAMIPRAAPPDDLPEQMRVIGLPRTPLILSPERQTNLPRAVCLRRPCDMALWDISGGKDVIRETLHPKFRNQLKRAEKQKMHVTRHRLAPDPDGPVLRTAARQAKARRYAIWPAPLTAAFAAVAPDQTHVFRATDKGEELAHLLFLTHGATATYHLGHTTPLGKTRCAHNLLLWRAAKHFATRGITCIDLGLVSGQNRPLDRFKLRTGAVVAQSGGTHLYWRAFG